MDIYTDRRTGYDSAAAPTASGGRLRRLRGRLRATLAAWRLRRVERRCLDELDDRMMADIGRPCRVPPPRAVLLDRGC